jgi:hypothetical protein
LLKKEFDGEFLVLKYPDYSRDMELYVDASLVGMRAMLMQRTVADNQLNIVFCASRAFRGAELNYSTIGNIKYKFALIIALIIAIPSQHNWLQLWVVRPV